MNLRGWLVSTRCLGAVLLPAVFHTASAADAPASDLLGPAFNLVVENDMVVRTDRHYTHGTKFTYLGSEVDVARAEPGFSFPHWLAERTPDFGAVPHAARVGGSLGQSIFTPTDISISALQTDDRPYAGVLYASLLLQKRGVTPHGRDLMDSWRLDLGIIGPEAQGEEAQNTVHRVRNLGTAQGWAHQLRTEPALALRYQRTWRWVEQGAGGWGWDFLPTAGVSLGNIGTYAALGGQVRAGWQLPADFGIKIIDSITMPTIGRTRAGTKRGFYAFAGVEGHAVAYNAFLDGNLWQSSHHVDKFPLVGDAKFGLAYSGQRYEITLTQVIRSKEFVGQKQTDAYGALALSVKFDHPATRR